MVVSSVVMVALFIRVGLVAASPILKSVSPGLADGLQPLFDISGKGFDIVFGELLDKYSRPVHEAIDRRIKRERLGRFEVNLVKTHLRDIFTKFAIYSQIDADLLVWKDFSIDKAVQEIKSFAEQDVDFREFRSSQHRLSVLVLELVDIQYQTMISIPEFQITVDNEFRAAVMQNFKALQADLTAQNPYREALRKLKIPASLRREDRMKSPTNVLRAADRLVPFQGRRTVQTDLLEWAERMDHPAAGDGPVRVYAAVGGAGKSRLMIELCREWCGQDGQAGFLAADDATPEILERLTDTRKPAPYNQPVLIVIDDVERFPTEALHRTVTTLAAARRDGDAQAVNLVLLARNADAREGWLRDLIDRVDRSGLVAAPRALEFPEGVSRQHVYDESIQAFRAALLDPQPPASQPWRTPTSLADPTNMTFDRVLYIQLAALAEVLGIDPNSFQSGTDLLTFAYQRERQHLHEILDKHEPIKGDDEVRQAAHVIIMAMALGANIADQTQLDQALEAQLPHYDGGRITRVRRVLQSLYPPISGSGRALAPLRPDLLAEQWIYEMTR
jgi:hypothetical protein